MRPRPSAALCLALGLSLGAAACTGSDAAPTAAAGGAASSSPAGAGPATSSPDAAAGYASALRDRLRLPSLPSFNLPTDLLSSGRDSDLAARLELEPGLYEGIAVVGARCGPGGEPESADSGTPLTGPEGAGSFKDAERSVTVAGDGTGTYDGPGLHVAVLSGGNGVYDDGAVRLSVQDGGAGTYEDDQRRLTVRTDGSGSYSDDEVRLWVGPDGAGGYDDDDTHVSLGTAGVLSGDGEPARVEAVRAVLRERLPRFAPVPRISRVAVRGTACGTIIRLDANVLFDFDADVLRPEAKDLLTRVATLLTALDSPRASVDGYTDGRGEVDYNLALSQGRAGAVRAELVRLGVAGDALTARGLGESRPVRPETLPDGADDPAARQLNRRVELVLADG